MGDNAHKGNSHRSPLPFSKCLSQPPVHRKFTNRLLPPYWKRWSLYGKLIMRIEYLSDKLWLEVTPCIVPMMPGSASRVGGIGAAPDYGEVVSKSFLLAHRPDWWLVGLCAFSFWKLLIGLMNWKERLYISLWRHNFAHIAENHWKRVFFEVEAATIICLKMKAHRFYIPNRQWSKKARYSSCQILYLLLRNGHLRMCAAIAKK